MNKFKSLLKIPAQGEHADTILAEIRKMKQQDIRWQEGKAWSLVYSAGKEHDELLKAASNELYSDNYLNPMAFRSLHTMEQEVVHMTAEMLHGDDQCVGVMTSGGTESILLALFAYRQRAQKNHPHILLPEIVAPATIHPAFDKAALYFGIRIRKVAVDENMCAVAASMETHINKNTILLLASAPGYPHGAMDPVEEIAAVARKYRLPLHVDACIGGFMLPWIEKLGYPVPKWDYRLKEVTSISADVHKFGFGAKGSSVITYRSMDYMRHQFTVTTDFPGGIYISPTLLGTRPGGPIAAAWAGMRHLGENGYMAMADNLMKGAQKLKHGLEQINGIKIIGKPIMNLMAFTTENNKPDIYVIADQLEAKGWMADRQQFPECIHLTVLPTNLPVIEQYLKDLKEAYIYAKAHPADVAKGNAAVYGMMARVSFRGMVEKSARKIMEQLFGKPVTGDENMNSPNGKTIKSPFWMGWLNRLMKAWQSRRHTF